jgi:hypothetical protein
MVLALEAELAVALNSSHDAPAAISASTWPTSSWVSVPAGRLNSASGSGRLK